jgi:glutamate-1-semialdehyde 2,1-aminomutase
MNNGLAFDLARTLMPGGVSSPVRSFRAVGGTPVFISRGAGSKVFGLDGKPYLDFIMGYGPMIAGHAHPVVTEAVRRQLDDGVCFGMPGAKEARSGWRGRRPDGRSWSNAPAVITATSTHCW